MLELVEAWTVRRLSAAGRERIEREPVFLSPLEERIQFSERLTAILLMIPSAGTAVLTYYGVAGPLTETGSNAIQKGQAVGFALTIGVFIGLGWFYLFSLIHRLEGRQLRNALVAGGAMVAAIALIDAPFNMLALAGGPAAQMSLVDMARAYEQRYAKLKTQEEKTGPFSVKGRPGKVSASFGQSPTCWAAWAPNSKAGSAASTRCRPSLTAPSLSSKGTPTSRGVLSAKSKRDGAPRRIRMAHIVSL